MRQITFALVVLLSFSVLFAQKEEESRVFTVLSSKGATIYGNKIHTLQVLDDVTKIQVQAEGFIALVDNNGTTYEFEEDIYTNDLTSHLAPSVKKIPDLSFITSQIPQVKESGKDNFQILYPNFSDEGSLNSSGMSPITIYWEKQKEIFGSYTVSVLNKEGNKIQDFKTSRNEYKLSPDRYGELNGAFKFVTSCKNFDGEKIATKTYSIELKETEAYEIKASDLVIKAICLEKIFDKSLKVWQELMAMPNGKHYADLYKSFLIRNKEKITQQGNDMATLMKVGN